MGDIKNVINDNLNSSGTQVPNFGGNFNNDANNGTFYYKVNNSTSNTNSNIGSRLT